MYDEVFRYVADFLSANDGEATKIGHFPFRKRSEHIWRVYRWAERLIDDSRVTGVDKDAVLTAALFHDAGYATASSGAEHAENSAVIFSDYAGTHDYDPDKAKFICYLIRNHSKKELLLVEDTPLELILLMEADLLDETGALSIVWDCMVEGAQDDQSFSKTYDHIKNYSGKILESNPMRTDVAQEFWSKKQGLTDEFINQLAFDLGN